MSAATIRQEIEKARAQLQLADLEHSDAHRRTYGECYCLPPDMRKAWLAGIARQEEDLARAEAIERETIKTECAMGKFLRMTEQ